MNIACVIKEWNCSNVIESGQSSKNTKNGVRESSSWFDSVSRLILLADISDSPGHSILLKISFSLPSWI